MKQTYKVSIWIGVKDSVEVLTNTMREVYDEAGDVSSDFMKSFNINYIDNQFQEVTFATNQDTKEEFFLNFSYISSFLESIPDKQWNTYNSIICLYNFEYEGEIKLADGLEFIGVFDYIPD